MQFCKKSGQSISNGALMDIRVSYLKTIKSINARKNLHRSSFAVEIKNRRLTFVLRVNQISQIMQIK